MKLIIGGSSLNKIVEVFTKGKLGLRQIIYQLTYCHCLFGDNIKNITSTTSKYSDSPWCDPNAPHLIDVFLVVFGDKKVSRIPESYIGIQSFLPVQASRCHVTTPVLYVTVYKKCTQTLKIIPYQWFRYAFFVPTVARVHFLNLKSLVCILIFTGSTWDLSWDCRMLVSKTRFKTTDMCLSG